MLFFCMCINKEKKKKEGEGGMQGKEAKKKTEPFNP